MSKHTPGPWVVGEGRGIHTVPNKLGGRTIVVEKHSIGLSANAKLIAAAPEMLAKLERLEKYLGSLLALKAVEGPTINEELASIASVIRAAKGGDS